jgi:phosphomevalonate kinase
MGHYPMNQHTHHGSFTRRRKRQEQRIFEEIKSESSPNLVKDIYTNMHKTQIPSNMNSKKATLKCVTNHFLKTKNLESNKREETQHIQGNFRKIISKLMGNVEAIHSADVTKGLKEKKKMPVN